MERNLMVAGFGGQGVMPVAMPLMMVVAGPVSACSAIFLTNL